MTKNQCSVNKRPTLLFFTLTAIFTLLLPISVKATENDYSVHANAAFAVDMTSGKILYDQNGDEVLGIASMTKLITTYIVYREVEKGTISWDDPLPVSQRLIKLSQDPELSNIPLTNKQQFTVKEALTGALVASANSLTSALAEYISGTELDFVYEMDEQLNEWGITDASIVSASGLSNEYMEDYYPGSSKMDENMMSAKDMAIVARHLIQDYPEVLEITALPSVTFFEGTKEEVTATSSNYLLPGFYWYKEGVDGLKTGTTDLAGACFVGTMETDGRRLITVVMNVDEDYSRFEETGLLMDHVLETWSYDTVIKAQEPADQSTIPVAKSRYKDANIMTTNDAKLWQKEIDSITLTFEPNTKLLNKDGELPAPISKETVIGEVHAVNTSDTLGFLSEEEAALSEAKSDVTLTTDLEKDNIFIRLWYKVTGKN